MTDLLAVTDEEIARCRELRVVGCRFLEPDREITLRPLLWGNWQLCIGPRGDEFGFDDAYMYASFERAAHALACWHPTPWDPHPPAGWHRHDSTGERRPLVH